MANRISRRIHNDERTIAEWVTLAVSLLLLAGLVGGLVSLELGGGDEPANLRVTLDHAAVERHGDQWYLPVTIRNEGDLATGTARIEFEHQPPGGEPEPSEVELTFLAGGEEETATVVFDERPGEGDVEVSVASITEP